MIKYKYFQFLFLIALIGSPNIIFSQDLGNGLVSVWEFDESSGDAIDSYGTNNGTVFSATRQQATVSNLEYSYDFSGSSQYVTVPSNACVLSSTFSISFWIKTTDSSDEDIFYYGPSTSNRVNGNTFHIRMDAGSSGYGIKFECDGYNSIRWQGRINDGSWHHIAIANSGTNISEVVCYIDGTLRSKEENDSQTLNFTASTISIAKGIVKSYFDGNLDQIVLWNRALSQTEINQLYGSGGGLAYSQWGIGSSSDPLVGDTISISNSNIEYNTVPDEIIGTEATDGDCASYYYSWEYSTDDGNNWVLIDNSNSVSYQPGALLETTTFRRKVECSAETSYSNEVTIAVGAASQTSSLSIGNPANGLDLTDQILKLSLAGSSTTGALSASDWLRFSQDDNYGSWLFQAGNNSVAPIESHNRIFLKEGSGISIKDSSYSGGQYRNVTLSLDGEAMEGDGNNYPNSLQFNPSTGNLTIGIEGLEDDLICNLDGRYLTLNSSVFLDDLEDVEIAGAQNGDVLKYINGTWQCSSDSVREAGTGDNWGTQLVVTDLTISGDGANSQLSLSQQNAADGQVLKWNNALDRWAPARDRSGTENQDVVADNITLSGSGSELNPLMLAPQDANPGEVLKWNDDLNRWAPASDIGAEVSNSVWKSNGNNIYYTLGSVNIGYGDTTQNLYVNGKIYAKEVIVQTSISQPDYVFEKDYPLMSLSDLKIYTEKHKHLPEIPSAKEVKENGVDLAKMNMLILQKVEELTLYTIDHHKRLNALEKIADMSLLNQCNN